MRVITLWEIHEWDGGDRQYYRGNCLASQEAADAYKASKRHDCVVKRVITVFDDLEDMEENSPLNARSEPWRSCLTRTRLCSGWWAKPWVLTTAIEAANLALRGRPSHRNSTRMRSNF